MKIICKVFLPPAEITVETDGFEVVVTLHRCRVVLPRQWLYCWQMAWFWQRKSPTKQGPFADAGRYEANDREG